MDNSQYRKVVFIGTMIMVLSFLVAASFLWSVAQTLMEKNPPISPPSYKSLSETIVQMEDSQKSKLLLSAKIADQAIEESMRDSNGLMRSDRSLMSQLGLIGAGKSYLLFVMMDEITQTDLRPHAELIFLNKEATIKDYQRFLDRIIINVEGA